MPFLMGIMQFHYTFDCIPYAQVWYREQTGTVEPVYCGHLGTNQKLPDCKGVLIFQVRLYDKALSVWIMQVSLFLSVLIFKCPD